MLDLFAPLGHPPLDEFSVAQQTISAVPVPGGILELELGSMAGVSLSATPVLAPARNLGAVRAGLGNGWELDLALPGNARQVVGLRFAPIPGLLALQAGWSPEWPGVAARAQELGAVLELATPWVTPRMETGYVQTASGGIPHLVVGADLPILPGWAAGFDGRLGFGSGDRLAFGTRLRLPGNLAFAAFGHWELPRDLAGGVLLAWRL